MLDKSLLNRIDEWIDSHKEEYLADLARLVAVPSAANLGVAPGEFPFGEGSAAVLKTAKEMAEGYGFEVENRDNFCLVAHVGAGSEKVGILGHLDVVPCGDDWKYPPYALTRLPDGDTIVGRGVMDDKGPLWASVYAVRCLKELGVLPRRAIEIFMGGDEECGMEDVKHYKATSERLPVVTFTPDSEYPICHGEKGIMRFNFTIPNESSNVVSFVGGTVRNVVAGHAELVLSGVSFDEAAAKLAGRDRVSVALDGENVKIIAEGASVHASTPENGVNAIGVAANAALEAGLAKGGAVAALGFIAKVLSDYNGAAIGVPLEDEPSGKLTHVGGVVRTGDGVLDLSIDIRYPVTCKGGDVLAAITAETAKYGVSVYNVTDSAPLYIPADSELVGMCMETVGELFPEKTWKPYTMGGGTYARNMPNAYALGAEDPDFVSPFGLFRGGIHQPDECAGIAQLVKTMKIYARLLLKLDEMEF